MKLHSLGLYGKEGRQPTYSVAIPQGLERSGNRPHDLACADSLSCSARLVTPTPESPSAQEPCPSGCRRALQLPHREPDALAPVGDCRGVPDDSLAAAAAGVEDIEVSAGGRAAHLVLAPDVAVKEGVRAYHLCKGTEVGHLDNDAGNHKNAIMCI